MKVFTAYAKLVYLKNAFGLLGGRTHHGQTTPLTS